MSERTEQTALRVDALWETVEQLWDAVAAAGIELPERPTDPVLVGLVQDERGDWVAK